MYRPGRGRSIRVGSRVEAKGMWRRPKRRNATVIVVALACVAVAATALVLLLTRPGGQPASGADTSLGSGTIYEGVFVEDLKLGGLTRDEAKAKIEALQKEFAADNGVTVTKDAMKVLYSISELPHSFDTDAVVNEAWAQGRTGTDAEKRAAIAAMLKTPVKLKLSMTIDTAPLEAKIRELAEPYEVTSVDAKLLHYDPTKPEGQRMSFSADIPGSRVNADELWAAVKKQFDDRTFGAVEMAVVTVDAKIKLADLQGMKLIGECDTYLSNHKKERYNNIKLASQAISGIFLQPGETFSFNDTTGERTAAKGYMDAPIDNQGVEDVGIGGGICQVSGTLFNASMRAGLTYVERHHHSVPSAYLKKGKDATVDYGKYDLKFKNDYKTPVLIIMHFGVGDGKDKYTLYAEIYGPGYPEGIKGYDLEAQLDRELPAKEGWRRVGSKSLLPGETKIIEPHKGYVIKVYMKTILADGTEKLSEQPLYVDTYDPDCQVVVYYYEDDKPTGVPTATPSATPEPEATPAPTPEATPAPSPTPEGTAAG